IDAAEYNRNDRFSRGNLIALHVPGPDSPQAFARTGAVPITDVARSFDKEQPIVVINADTGRRQLLYSELDQNPDAHPEDPSNVALIVRPAVNWSEGGHYIVALRDLRTQDGATIPAPGSFLTYR